MPVCVELAMPVMVEEPVPVCTPVWVWLLVPVCGKDSVGVADAVLDGDLEGNSIAIEVPRSTGRPNTRAPLLACAPATSQDGEVPFGRAEVSSPLITSIFGITWVKFAYRAHNEVREKLYPVHRASIQQRELQKASDVATAAFNMLPTTPW